MKRYLYIITIASIFMAISGLAYLLHYYIFQDVHHIFIYMIGDLAFLPLEVLLVVIVIERVLARREKQTMLNKLNMVVGAFFSEVGNRLLGDLLNSFEHREEISQHLAVNQNWTARDFKKAMAFSLNIPGSINPHNIDLEGLKTFLVQKRLFLLALLENPNLLEYERFTDLLWAVFHLTEELEVRPTMTNLPDSDIQHIASDAMRMYDYLTTEWVAYVEHLKNKYPYLFSLVARTHPFQEHPSPIVT